MDAAIDLYPAHSTPSDLPRRTAPPSPDLVASVARSHLRLVRPPAAAGDRPKIVVSYGVGVDSTAMLVLMWKSGVRPDKILFANTGSERPETIAYIPVINAWLRSVGFPEVTELRYDARRLPYTTLLENCIAMGMLPSLAYGGHKHGCSLKWKVGVLDKHVAAWPEAKAAWKRGERVVRVIGYDDSPADNARRGRFESRGGKAETAKYLYWYALQEAGWDRARCIEEIRAAIGEVPPKSACFFCPSTKPHEIIELVLKHPELAWQVIEMERIAGPGLDVIDGLWGEGSKGTRGGVPKPGSMAEYILCWMIDGRAYGRLPRSGDKGIVDAEVRAMPGVGRVFRLPVLGEPDRDELAALSERGAAAALSLRERFEALHGPVDAFLALGRERAARRTARRTAKRVAKRDAARAAKAAAKAN